MIAEQILSKARELGVRLSIDGDDLKLKGRAEAIAEIRPILVEHKAEVRAYLLGAAEFWPWAPYLGVDDVHRMRSELIGAIEEIASLECWPPEHRDDVLTRAIRGPLADLLPNVHHFNEGLQTARAEAAARAAVACRTWRFDR
jgi:hypothetical protein